MLIGTGIGFLISGIDCMENNLMIIAISSFIVGFLNIAASLFNKRHPFYTKTILLVINALFAFISSYVYYTAGRDKIQYGWAVVGIISIFALIRAFRKRAKERAEVV